MSAPRTLLVQLLDYIKEQAKKINPQAYRLGSARGFTRARNDLVGLPGIEFDLRVEGDHIWLRIPRLVAEPPPKPPEVHKSLLKANPDPSGSPPAIDDAALGRVVSNAIKEADPSHRTAIESNIRAAAGKALESYSTSWNSWAEGERSRRQTIALYGDLFALMQQMQAEETSKPMELVWGIGIASWLLSYEEEEIEFEYPLLTQAIEVTLDENTMAIELRPRATETRVEVDAFVACRVPWVTEVEKASREQLIRNKERPVTPFDPSSYSDVLKLVAGNLDSEGTYREIIKNDGAVPSAGENLVVTDAWALISRPRTTNYLFDDLKRLQEKLEGGCEIPIGPGALVTPPSDKPIEYEAVNFRGISSRGASGSSSTEELYFPLPYNEEQVTIVQRLRRAAGVTVQGPPGTGKTHTIANIICHYLASGLRVLVTSRGEAALSVLQAKIPEEVRPLTVALLASDREGVRQFKASIEAIQHRVSQLNPELTRQEIVRIEGAIDRAHADLAAIDRRVDEIALAQLSEVEIDGAPMRPQKLAELVLSGREQFGWFDDPITLSPEHTPPFSEDEAGRMREARRHLGTDIVYVQSRVPSPDDFPPEAVIAELHNVLLKRNSIQAEVDRGELLALKANTPDVLSAARILLTAIEETLGVMADIEAVGETWPFNLRLRCREVSFGSERSALESLFEDLDALTIARAEFLKRPVTFPEAGLQSSKTLEAVSRARATGKPFGLVALGAGDAKEHIASIRVTGKAPSGTDDWAHVGRFVELHERIESFAIRWNELADGLSIPRLNGGVAALRHVELVANAARKAHHLATKHDPALLSEAQAVFEHPPAASLTGDRAGLESVRQQLIRHLTLAELSLAAMRLSDFQGKMSGKSGPISDELRRFLRRDLGSSNLPVERVAAQYSEIKAELRRIALLSVFLSTVKDAADRMESAGAARLASRIRSLPVADSGEDTTFPTTWRQAWNWARIRSYLESIEGRDELLSLASRRREFEAGLARLYRDMVAKAAWLATKRNATPRVLGALTAYASAIHLIGQGTGPNATRYRRDAHNAMHDAAAAVPCWKLCLPRSVLLIS